MGNKLAETETEKNEVTIGYVPIKDIVDHSKTLNSFIQEIIVATKLTPTGIVNIVVGHEEKDIVRTVLRKAFKVSEIWEQAWDLDAYELQLGKPGSGKAAARIDEKLFGTVKMKKADPKDPSSQPYQEVDVTTGTRVRNRDGLVNRVELNSTESPTTEKTMILHNLDTCLDFCGLDQAGDIDLRYGQMFVTYTDKNIRNHTRLVLITSVPLSFKSRGGKSLPFPCTKLEFPKITEIESKNIIHDYIHLFTKRATTQYEMNMTKLQEEQAIRKLVGLTYTQACEIVGFALIASKKEDGSNDPKKTKKLIAAKFLKELRNRINGLYLRDAKGITVLDARPWDDYVLPESSNFTYHVQTALRDFREIAEVRQELSIKQAKNASISEIEELEQRIEALENNIPHTMLLYGKGGVGKSAFPVHYAGLLGYDVIDFNINAMHSKWIGEGGENIRKALDSISKTTHLVIRIDEYDRGMGSTDSNGSGMHEAHKQVEMEIMNWLANSCEQNLFRKNKVILVMTTNHKENLTGPLIRSGRMDLAIDISSFDPKAMLTTLKSAARRMYNRGVIALGFKSPEEFQKAIDSLDTMQIATLLTSKRFTVRDVEMLLLRMARHRYYKNKYGNEGIEWNTNSFVKVLEYSEGSVKDDTTGELIIGDDQYIKELSGQVKKDSQPELRLGEAIYDEASFKTKSPFTEVSGTKSK